MGGNALTVFTRRYNKQEYLELQLYLANKLRDAYNFVVTIPSYTNKDSYGDLDLLVTKPKPTNLDNFLTVNFNTKQIVHNNQYVSFEHKELGKFISSYKNSKEDFSSYIIHTEISDIKQDIVNYFND